MRTSEVLYATADYIEVNGWWSSNGDCTGPNPACAANAILRVTVYEGLKEAFLPTVRAMSRYLGDEGGFVGSIWNWNDTPGRTQQEVVQALRAAAVIEAAKEAEATTQPAVGVGAGSAS